MLFLSFQSGCAMIPTLNPCASKSLVMIACPKDGWSTSVSYTHLHSLNRHPLILFSFCLYKYYTCSRSLVSRSLILALSIRILTGFTIILADNGHTSSNTSRPFSRRVDPVSTISTITSDSPTIGASSMEPFNLMISTVLSLIHI